MGNKVRRVDEVEEELDPSRPKRKPRFPAPEKTLPHKVKSASQMSESQYLAICRENPYVIERDHMMPRIRGKDTRFHTAFQAQCYHEILMRKPSENVVHQFMGREVQTFFF